jgi:hypothetical protein
LGGAQAVYIRTASSSLSVAPFTTDADLAVDPETIGSAPAIDDLMQRAGFRQSAVGTWAREAVVEGRDVNMEVDVMVPAAVAPGSGRRGVDLSGHDRKATRRTAGIEAALVDNDRLAVGSLQAGDARSHLIRVAGPAALLVSKLYKVSDRRETKADRQSDKDATDIYRLFQVIPSSEMNRRLAASAADLRSSDATRAALGFLEELFGRRGSVGIQMVERNLGASGPGAPAITTLSTGYVSQLLEHLHV